MRPPARAAAAAVPESRKPKREPALEKADFIFFPCSSCAAAGDCEKKVVIAFPPAAARARVRMRFLKIMNAASAPASCSSRLRDREPSEADAIRTVDRLRLLCVRALACAVSAACPACPACFEENFSKAELNFIAAPADRVRIRLPLLSLAFVFVRLAVARLRLAPCPRAGSRSPTRACPGCARPGARPPKVNWIWFCGRALMKTPSKTLRTLSLKKIISMLSLCGCLNRRVPVRAGSVRWVRWPCCIAVCACAAGPRLRNVSNVGERDFETSEAAVRPPRVRTV